jgi:hypothetical protein
LWRSRWNVDWQGKPKFSEKTCPSATFVHHKIPHDQTRVWISLPYLSYRRLSGSQSRSGNYTERTNFLHLPGIQPQILSRPARNLVALSTKISRFLFLGIAKIAFFYRFKWKVKVPLLCSWPWDTVHGFQSKVIRTEVRLALLIQAPKNISCGSFSVLMCRGTLMGSSNGHVPY